MSLADPVCRLTPGFGRSNFSVQKLGDNVRKFGETIKGLKKIQTYAIIVIVIALSTLLVAVMGYIYTTHDSVAQARIDAENARSAVKLQQVEVENKYEKINVEMTELKEKGIELEKAQSNHIKELQNKISELENSLSELQNKKEKQGN